MFKICLKIVALLVFYEAILHRSFALPTHANNGSQHRGYNNNTSSSENIPSNSAHYTNKPVPPPFAKSTIPMNACNGGPCPF
ncbi:hypothetical protein PPACK8108_LOCUS21302 [Phakopsora pachyrhizi]|uniref:Secreted protein n=1 Tax=Phakopsora pachyrhizi TaxID=170000 RepID=A0AAV0BJ83_PHAPC|nr:hypothetical protein PPACK8108_LOCUS21302 [Phakopsora pachyrhizi]